jgi:pimeloyl-ACP methyl ester carboxylesterase
LAIGANTAIVTVTRGVLSRPLPYGAPESLVAVFQRSPKVTATHVALSAPTLADLRARQTTLTGIAAFLQRQATWRLGNSDPQIVNAMRALRRPGTAHAMCDDYRAGASIDEAHQAETRDRRITCPLLVLWGERSVVGRQYDALALWRDVATDVRGRALPAGHFLPEEVPDRTLAEVLAFMGE